MDNPGDNDAMLVRLAELQGEFSAAIARVDPGVAVPWCGDWAVADLVEHLTQIHHWAAAMARNEDARPLRTEGDLRTRYDSAAAELLTTLGSLDPGSPARTLVDGGTVAFWHRRQLHETLVHLWDLRTVAGLPVVAEPELWADTVDEAVTVMHPRQVRLGRAAEAPVRLELVAADVDRVWRLPGAARDSDAPTVAVSAPAEVLALLLWGRVDTDDARLRVDGDLALVQAVLDDHFLP